MTDRAVVDTNVLVVANGRATHVDEACQLSCVDEHVWQKMGDPNRIHVTPVDPLDPEGRDFADPVLPRNNLKKDAKFLAVAVKADAVIVNATDSDWAGHHELTDRLGVDVRQLCPQHAVRPKTSRDDHASQ